MKPDKNKLNANFRFINFSHWSDLTLMLYKSTLNPGNKEKGTALVAAMGFGLLLLLLSSIAIVRSGKENVNASVNQSTEQSLAITKAGVNTLMAQLNSPSLRPLLLLNYDLNDQLGCVSSLGANPPSTQIQNNCNQWANVNNTVTLSYNTGPTTVGSSCSASTPQQAAQQVTSFSTTGHSGGTPGQVGVGTSGGQYKLLGYRFVDPDNNPTTPANQFGRLLVEGNLSQTGKTDSRSRFEVRFPVTIIQSMTGGTGAALMGNRVVLDQTDVKADTIVCTDPSLCPINCGGDGVAQASELKTAIGGTSNAIVTGLTTTDANVRVGGSSIPPIPSLPSGASITNLGNIANTVRLPRTVGDGSGVTVNDPSYTVGGVTYYYYQIGSWTSNSSVLIKNGQTAQFRIYVSGNIDYSGNNGIGIQSSGAPIAPSPGQIRLYGGLSNGSSPNTQTWSFGGTFCQTAFIHAPKANVTFNGGGTGCKDMVIPNPTGSGTITFPANNAPNFYGAVWVNQFLAGSTNSTYFYEQPSLMGVLNSDYGAGAFAPQTVAMSSITQFERKPVP